MRGLGAGVALIVALALAPVPADASAQVRPIGRIPADGSTDARPAWERTLPAPAAPRYGAKAVFVDGQYLVLGGRTGARCPDGAGCTSDLHRMGLAPPDIARDAALYDPGLGVWTPTPLLPVPIEVTDAVASDGVVFAWGYPADYRDHHVPVLLAYDPAALSWSRLPIPDGAIECHLVDAGGTLVALADIGGRGQALFRFDPVEDRWRALPALPAVAEDERFTVAVWAAGRLLIGANRWHRPVRLAALDPDGTAWTEVRPSRPIVSRGSPVVAADRVVFPGDGGVHDPATGRTRPLPKPLRSHGFRPDPLLVVGDRVVVAGHLFDPVTFAYEALRPLPGRLARNREPAVGGGPDGILRLGGAPNEGGPNAPTPDAYFLRLDPGDVVP